jgi:hypothetical protein
VIYRYAKPSANLFTIARLFQQFGDSLLGFKKATKKSSVASTALCNELVMALIGFWDALNAG